MSKDNLIDAFSRVDEDMILEVEVLRRNKKKTVWIRWVALAACLCMTVGIIFFSITYQAAPDSPMDAIGPHDGPPGLVVNGIDFLISPHPAVFNELPDGFVYAGTANVGGFEDCPYYINSDIPEWVYVYHEVLTDGAVDSTGTLINSEPHNAYVRYVDERLRGKDLVCYNGSYFISMWSADYYADTPDVSKEYYDAMYDSYGVRMEGDPPKGFVCVGTADFFGVDTIPRGALACNQGAYKIYASPDAPDVVLVMTHWYTFSSEERKEIRHDGFNVFIRYECPLI